MAVRCVPSFDGPSHDRAHTRVRTVQRLAQLQRELQAVESAIAAAAPEGGEAAPAPRQLKQRKEGLTRSLTLAKRDNKKAQGEVWRGVVIGLWQMGAGRLGRGFQTKV